MRGELQETLDDEVSETCQVRAEVVASRVLFNEEYYVVRHADAFGNHKHVMRSYEEFLELDQSLRALRTDAVSSSAQVIVSSMPDLPAKASSSRASLSSGNAGRPGDRLKNGLQTYLDVVLAQVRSLEETPLLHDFLNEVISLRTRQQWKTSNTSNSSTNDRRPDLVPALASVDAEGHGSGQTSQELVKSKSGVIAVDEGEQVQCQHFHIGEDAGGQGNGPTSQKLVKSKTVVIAVDEVDMQEGISMKEVDPGIMKEVHEALSRAGSVGTLATVKTRRSRCTTGVHFEDAEGPGGSQTVQKLVKSKSVVTALGEARSRAGTVGTLATVKTQRSRCTTGVQSEETGIKAELAVGSVVKVIHSFPRARPSNSTPERLLRVGEYGTVTEIDEEGDALIYFGSGEVWVHHQSFSNLLEGLADAAGSIVRVVHSFDCNSTPERTLHVGEYGAVREIDDDGDAFVHFGSGEAWVYDQSFPNLHEGLAAGSVVKVINSFNCNSTPERMLHIGEFGTVREIDEEGDAFIYFGSGEAWVYHQNIPNLRDVECAGNVLERVRQQMEESRAAAVRNSQLRVLCRTLDEESKALDRPRTDEEADEEVFQVGVRCLIAGLVKKVKFNFWTVTVVEHVSASRYYRVRFAGGRVKKVQDVNLRRAPEASVADLSGRYIDNRGNVRILQQSGSYGTMTGGTGSADRRKEPVEYVVYADGTMHVPSQRDFVANISQQSGRYVVQFKNGKMLMQQEDVRVALHGPRSDQEAMDEVFQADTVCTIVGLDGSQYNLWTVTIVQHVSEEVNLWKYTPANGLEMHTRQTPEIEGVRTKHCMNPGDMLRIVEEKPGLGEVLFLKLEDNKGWVFDHKPGVGVMCVRHHALQSEAGQYQVRLHDGRLKRVRGINLRRASEVGAAAHGSDSAQVGPRTDQEAEEDIFQLGTRGIIVGLFNKTHYNNHSVTVIEHLNKERKYWVRFDDGRLKQVLDINVRRAPDASTGQAWQVPRPAQLEAENDLHSYKESAVQGWAKLMHRIGT